MRYVKLTEDQSKKMNPKNIGYTSGSKDKETGKRSVIKFCSSLDFIKVFGLDIERVFIEI